MKYFSLKFLGRAVPERQSRAAFTLPELLVTLAIIGVLVSIVVPVLTGINETSRKNKAKANARSAAGVCAAARAAGASFSGSTVEELLTTLSTGVDGRGQLTGSRFHFAMDGSSKAEVLEWLTLEHGDLIYRAPE